MEKKKFLTPNHEIINRFIHVKTGDKYFWPREIKITKKLVTQFNLEFILQLPEPFGTKIPSMAWFLTNEGKIYLNNAFFQCQQKKLDFSPKFQQVELLPVKIGEDVEIIKKPKTLKDFLKV